MFRKYCLLFLCMIEVYSFDTFHIHTIHLMLVQNSILLFSSQESPNLLKKHCFAVLPQPKSKQKWLPPQFLSRHAHQLQRSERLQNLANKLTFDRPFVRLLPAFLEIGSLVFSDFWHKDAKWQCPKCDGAWFSKKKKKNSAENAENMPEKPFFFGIFSRFHH